MNTDIVQLETKRKINENEQEIMPVLLVRQETVMPDLMTEEEVIEYLRIPCVSDARNYKHVIDNLIRFRDLPCIHISRKRLFPRKLVRDWILRQYQKEAA